MKKFTLLFFLFLSLLAQAGNFTSGNIVVLRVGNGSAALTNSAHPVFLDEYSRSGALVQSVALPVASSGSNHPIALSGTATSEGNLTLSVDGRYLVLAGYDAIPGTALISSDSTKNRTIARIGSDGVPNTSTGFLAGSAYMGDNVRGAVSIDGSGFWAAGNGLHDIGGTYYLPFGSFTNSPVKISSPPNNTRTVGIFNGQLYVSAQTNSFNGVCKVGSGTPATSGNTTSMLPGFTAPSGFSVYSFWFFDMDATVPGADVLYFCDDRDVPPAGGIYKYSLVGGTWISNGNVSVAHSIKGMTAERTCFTQIFCVSGSKIFSLRDDNGYNQSISGTLNQIVLAGANTKFRGIAFSPGTTTAANVQASVVSSVNVSCFGGNNGSINVSASGGTPNYSFNWGNGITSQNRTNLSPGTYTVTVTDVSGCTASTSATITQPTQLSASATKTDVSCNGGNNGAITVTVSGGTSGYSYNWGSGITSQNRTNLSAGSYTVTVTDSKGCTATASATVGQPALLSASASKTDVSCNGGNNGTIAVTVNGGTPNYSFNWGSGITSQNRTNLSAGSYTVTVTDSKSCTATANVTITQPSALSLSASKTDVSCNGGANGAITLTVSGGTTPYGFSWSNNSVSQNLTGLSAGTYHVTVTDGNNCTAAASAAVGEPQALSSAIAAANVLCNGGNNGTLDLSVSGGTTPYSYNWSNGFSSQDLSGLTAGNYFVTISDSKGCSVTDNAAVTQPSVLTATPQATNVSCNGGNNGAIDLSVSGGTAPYAYIWSNQETTQDLNNLANGNFNVTVSDANGCSLVAGSVITQPAILSTAISKTNVSCNGGNNGSIDLSVSGGTNPYSYQWSNNTATQDLNGLSAGTFNVTVTDGNNCSASAGATITQPSALATSFTKTDARCFGENNGTVDLSTSGGTAPYSYSWSNSSASQDQSNLQAGSYSVTVTDANGCSATSAPQINEPLQLSASVLSADVNCFGGNDGSIDLTVTGGTTPYNYQWSNGQSLQDISGLSAGTYSATVADANGCSAAISDTIAQPTAILILWQVTDASCNGGTDGAIQLNVTGGIPLYSYLWNTGDTSGNLNSISSGLYSVTVTDNAGCGKTASIPVGESSALAISLVSKNDMSCTGGNDGAIDISVSGGSSPYNFIWSNGFSTEDILGLGAGNYSVTVSDGNNCSRVESYSVSAPPQITAVVSRSNVSCNGGSDGAANLSATGGALPYSFIWSDGSVAEDAAGLAEGIYFVTVTDANGCSASAGTIISQPSAISLSSVAADVKCNAGNDGAIDLSASGGTPPYSYSWSNGTQNQDISGLQAATYSVTVSDTKNCTVSTSAQVAEPLQLAVSILKEDVKCHSGNDGSIALSVTGGVSPYAFDWSNGSSAQTLSNLPAGNFDALITDANNCTVSVSAQITAPDSLVANLQAQDVKCFAGNDGAVSLTVSGGILPYQFSWSNNSGTQNISDLTAGAYSVTVSDSNGCVAAASVSVGQPSAIIITATVTNPACSGGNTGAIDLTVAGGTAGYSFNWSNNETSEDIFNLGADNYAVTVTDGNNCTANFSATVTQSGSLQVASVRQDVTCNGLSNGAISVSVTGGTPGYTFSWNDGSASHELNNLAAGIYTLTVTDANGCFLSLTDTISEPASIEMESSVSDIMCFGNADGSVELTVTGGTGNYSFNWSNGSVTQNLSGVSAGDFTVTVTDGNSCTASSVSTVAQPDSLSLTADVVNATLTTVNDGSIDLSVSGGASPYQFIWNDGSQSEDISSLDAGSYCVTVTDVNSCSLSRCFTVTEPVSVAENEFLEKLWAYSDGTKIKIHAKLKTGIDCSVKVFDITGKLLALSDSRFTSELNIEFAATHLSSGLILVNIVSEKNSVSRKLMLPR